MIISFIKGRNIMKKIYFLLLGTSMLSGCASLDTSNNIGFPIKTTPSGAKATAYNPHIKEQVSCTTPCKLTLRQTHNYVIKIDKKGYHHLNVPIKSQGSVEGTAGSLAANSWLLILAPVGMAVDGATGADDRLFPGHINAVLTPSNMPLPITAPTKSEAGNSLNLSNITPNKTNTHQTD